MMLIQKISVLFLALVFFFCIPIHIYGAISGNAHILQEHLHCGATIVEQQFAHFHEMTNVLLIAMLILIAGILVWRSCIRTAYGHSLQYSLRQTLREKFYAHTAGVFLWLRLQIMSPPPLIF